MSILLAKIKGQTSELFKILSSDTDIFTVPDISKNHEYSPSYKLEDDEWYRIKQFSDSDYHNELIEGDFDSVNYNQITTENYLKIDYLYCKQNNHFTFQKISPMQVVSKKWLSISDEPSIVTDKPIIILHDFVDAVYDKDSDVLYFKRIAKIKSMFDGIEELYRDATQEEVDRFLGHKFITMGKEFSSEKVKTANRKRIAVTMSKLEKFTDDDRQEIFKYIREYCQDVPFTDTTFIINTEDHLKQVLFGIDQRYYTTILGDEKRLANSVLNIGNNTKDN